VPLAEITAPANDYNLNIARYVDASEPEDIQYLHAHLEGGVPDRDVDALADYWQAFPLLRTELFAPNRPDYSDLTIPVNDVRETILDAPELKQFATDVTTQVDEWFAAHRPALEGITPETKPNGLIAALGDDLLTRFKSVPLLDEYDVYEQLMAYWHRTMHDDVFLVMTEGWLDASKPRKAIEDKDRKLSETPDLVIGSGRSATKFKMDLLPPALIVGRYFSKEWALLLDLKAREQEATQSLEEYLAEHAVDEGLLSEAIDGDKITKGSAKARLKEAKSEGPDPEEVAALEQVVMLFETEASAKKAVKDAQTALNVETLKAYGDLTVDVVKSLVLDDKWRHTLTARILDVLTERAHDLIDRIEQLGDRYGETLHELEAELATLDERVAGHLAEMDLI
jgi:type I restriction enzyme M protein